MAKRRPTTTARFCDQCSERILWASTDGGNVALNPTPNEAGGYLAFQSAAGAWIGRVNVVGPRQHLLERPFQAHAQTCKGARPDINEEIH